MGNFEPGADLVAKVTVLAEGTQGHLTGVALDHFGLRGDEPQVWELGVKEVWRVPKPLRGIVHTMGWPLRTSARYREFGGSFIYPMGDDLLTIGMVVGLDYRDAELSAHDLLQELKTHPKIRKILEGGERIGWGAKTIPSGGYHALPRRLHAPGLLLCGDGVGIVNIPRAEGRALRDRVGPARGRVRVRARCSAARPRRPRSRRTTTRSRRASSRSELHEVRDMRQVFGRGFFVGGALASAMTVSKGRVDARQAAEPSPTPSSRSSAPTAPSQLSGARRQAHLRQALVRLPLGEQDTRRPAEPHSHRAQGARATSRTCGCTMCPAQVYEIGTEGGDGTVTVNVAPSNCVQCGAITAKGGRLTPPEGGSGPEYTLT